MRKQLYAVAAAILAAGMLAGCSGTDKCSGREGNRDREDSGSR